MDITLTIFLKLKLKALVHSTRHLSLKDPAIIQKKNRNKFYIIRVFPFSILPHLDFANELQLFFCVICCCIFCLFSHDKSYFSIYVTFVILNMLNNINLHFHKKLYFPIPRYNRYLLLMFTFFIAKNCVELQHESHQF